MLKVKPVQSLSILIFDSHQGVMGAVIDKCLAVAEIPENDIEKTGAMGQHDSSEYFIGIGKRDGSLVTLIDLSKITDLMGAVT